MIGGGEGEGGGGERERTVSMYRSPTSSFVFPFMLSKLLFGSRIGSRFSARSISRQS